MKTYTFWGIGNIEVNPNPACDGITYIEPFEFKFSFKAEDDDKAAEMANAIAGNAKLMWTLVDASEKGKEPRIVQRVEVTVRYNGNDSVHEIYFGEDGLPMTDKAMYEDGFSGEITLEDEDGEEIGLNLEADNPEWFSGTYIDHLVFNLYDEDENEFDEAEVVAFKPIFRDSSGGRVE